MVYGDLPDPEVAPGEVMLRVHGSALNRADMGMRSRGRSGQGPRIMGMDVAGEVVSISPDANTTLRVGDRVLLENRTKCHVCEFCVDGNDQYCTSQKRIGVDLDGGHAEYITAPAINAYRIPDSMSYAEAAAMPLAGHTAWQCMVVQGQVKPWDDVLIQAAAAAWPAWPSRLPRWWAPGSSPPPAATGSWKRRRSGAPTRSSTTGRRTTSASGSRS